MEEPTVVGIDIAKKKFDVTLLVEGKEKSGAFQNTPEGFTMFARWLERYGSGHVHACMEATGTYGDDLALYLHRAGHVVSVVNPAKVKGFALSALSRTKTDKADARLIARFCRAMRPEPWQPPAPEIKELQSLMRRAESLNDMLSQERNRLGTTEGMARNSIERTISHLEEELRITRGLIRDHIDQHPDLRGKRDLLESIPGIGPATSAMILAEFGDVMRFQDARSMAAFCGLTPRQRQSGSSVRGKTRLSKTGSSRIRKALYMPALVAMTHNPVIAAFCERLRAYGKCPMVIVGAAMRKLVHIAYGVLKSGRPFDPSIAMAA
ncbi:MAG: IS110 family transposase [Dehalococcoidia bacterium]|jgi:transposase|nr:IS110 family transposase [Dehalococcoidia bacterium]